MDDVFARAQSELDRIQVAHSFLDKVEPAKRDHHIDGYIRMSDGRRYPVRLYQKRLAQALHKWLRRWGKKLASVNRKVILVDPIVLAYEIMDADEPEMADSEVSEFLREENSKKSADPNRRRSNRIRGTGSPE